VTSSGRDDEEAGAGSRGAGRSARIPAALHDFLELHRRGEHWESHEVLEGPWRATGSSFYQGLILYASAWVHWKRGNAHGVEAQLGKTLDRLEGYPDSYLGIDVEAVRIHCREVRGLVRSDVDRGSSEWPGHVAPEPLRVEALRIRGDEPELTPGGAGTPPPER
jgi:hypothetical protein